MEDKRISNDCGRSVSIKSYYVLKPVKSGRCGRRVNTKGSPQMPPDSSPASRCGTRRLARHVARQRHVHIGKRPSVAKRRLLLHRHNVLPRRRVHPRSGAKWRQPACSSSRMLASRRRANFSYPSLQAAVFPVSTSVVVSRLARDNRRSEKSFIAAAQRMAYARYLVCM